MAEDQQRKAVDWDAVERDYRAGLLSLREMATTYGCTEGAIRKRAKRDGWVRDLSAKIRAKAEALVRTEEVRSEVRSDVPTEKEVVDANADVVAAVMIKQRRGISRAQEVAAALLEELSHQTDNRELYMQLGELLHSPDDKGIDKLNELYHKAMSLPGRIGNIKALSETLKNLVTLERQAFNIDGARDPETPEPGTSKESLTDVARRMAFILASAVNQQEQS